MNYIYKYKLGSEQIMLEQQRRSEDRFKMMEQTGVSGIEIEQLRFDEKYKLDYPCDYFNSIIIEVMKEIFLNSDKIHKDVLFSMIKELTEIDAANVFSIQSDKELAMEILSARIMAVIIENMEMLYYIQVDEIFRALIFQICNILDLDLEDYGFSKVE